MALPAFIERVTHEDSAEGRSLSGHDIQAAIMAIHGGTVTVAEFKTAINATADDETDIDNIIALVTGNASAKNTAVLMIVGTLDLAHMKYFDAASARTRLGIATP